jgi:arylamine N-acetyltransferase
VYAARGGNFARTMLRLAAERERLTVIADQLGAPTGAELIADVTAHALRAERADRSLGGTYHLAAGGETSWHGYASFVIAEASAQARCDAEGWRDRADRHPRLPDRRGSGRSTHGSTPRRLRERFGLVAARLARRRRAHAARDPRLKHPAERQNNARTRFMTIKSVILSGGSGTRLWPAVARELSQAAAAA